MDAEHLELLEDSQHRIRRDQPKLSKSHAPNLRVTNEVNPVDRARFSKTREEAPVARGRLISVLRDRAQDRLLKARSRVYP